MNIFLGIISAISILISISVCIGVALFASQRRRIHHPVAYHVVDTDDTTDLTTTSSSFSTSVAAANSTNSYQPVNQPPSLSGTPASYTTQHHIPQPTRVPVTAASNEATTQPLPTTAHAPLVSSFDITRMIAGETPLTELLTPSRQIPVISFEFSIRYQTLL